MTGGTHNISAVAIGRNEGARLEACLNSLVGQCKRVVYVDSGSSDTSVAFAKSLGVEVVDLDMSQNFTAARARNEGFRRLQDFGALDGFVQFIDGDCELQPGWLDAAAAFLKSRADVALVCGRRRERFPEVSVFNRLCDIEWATPIGEARASGGDFLVRADAFDRVGGFNAALIAGEEPDLCFRLRAQGWKIWRLDEEMTLHDAAMTRLGQWWARTKRAGFAFANGSALHGASPERYWRRETLRAVVFGGALPFIALVGALIHPAALALFLYYPLQAARNYQKAAHVGEGRLAYAISNAVARIPEFFGVAKYWTERLLGRQSELIEYK